MKKRKYAVSNWANTKPLSNREYQRILESTLFTTDDLDNVKKLKHFNPRSYVTLLGNKSLTDKEYQRILKPTLPTTDNFNKGKKLKNFHPEAYVTF